MLPTSLLIALFVLLLPVLAAVIYFNLITISFIRLGIPAGLTILLFAASIVGSFINVPLWETRTVVRPAEVVHVGPFFLYLRPPQVSHTVLAVNVGGAVVPLLVSALLLPKAPLMPTLLATGVMTVIAYLLAQPVPGVGIVMNPLVPPIAAALLAWLLTGGQNAAPVAYIGGVVGVLVGADLLHLQEILRSPGVLSIGGAGVYDGIFLVGVIAAVLS
jgi:uncharacterized membrane protein